jgi:hypothetical protein
VLAHTGSVHSFDPARGNDPACVEWAQATNAHRSKIQGMLDAPFIDRRKIVKR